MSSTINLTNQIDQILRVYGTGGIQLPKGSTGQRPNGVLSGTIRWNTYSNALEVFDGTTWLSLVLVAGERTPSFLDTELGGEITGPIVLNGATISGVPTPASPTEIVPKQYVDDNFLSILGGNLFGPVDLGGNEITNLTDPIDPTDAVNLQTLDAKIAEATSSGGGATTVAVYDTSTYEQFSVPTNVKYIKCRIWGAGGGGAATTATSKGGAGGGGGAYVEFIVPVSEGDVFLIYAGAAGLAGTAGGAGTNGESSSININSSANYVAGGGTGATAPTDTVESIPGTGGIPNSPIGLSFDGTAGTKAITFASGEGIGGHAGAAMMSSGPFGNDLSGTSGILPGSGGSGAGPQSNSNGGNGAKGLVIIEY